MKPGGGLMIAVGTAKPGKGAMKDSGEAEESEPSSKPSASSELFTARANALAKIAGVPVEKQASFAKALKAVVMACMDSYE